MSDKIRLLVTMRARAAATHLVRVIKSDVFKSKFSLRVLAQRPASDLLLLNDIKHTVVDIPPCRSADSEDGLKLLAFVEREFIENPCDVILAGLSTPFDGGIDEAVLALAKVPTLLLQDFWGEQNRFFGKGADVALVLDEAAERRNKLKFNLPSVIVGSARHSAYQNLDFPLMRRDMRKKLQIADDRSVIGFFGQALNRLSGYRRTVRAFIRTVAELNQDLIVLVRSHPRETPDQQAELALLFKEAKVQTIFCNEGQVDTILPACDIVCSLFSNCTYDASYQNWFSSQPLSVPVSLLFDPEIATYYRERVDFEDLPIHAEGLVIPVYAQKNLATVLYDSLSIESKKKTWERAKKVLPDPQSSIKRIAEAISSELDKRTTGTFVDG